MKISAESTVEQIQRHVLSVIDEDLCLIDQYLTTISIEVINLRQSVIDRQLVLKKEEIQKDTTMVKLRKRLNELNNESCKLLSQWQKEFRNQKALIYQSHRIESNII